MANKKAKKSGRRKEIIKAQQNVSRNTTIKSNVNTTSIKQEKENSHKLPINLIKKDITKTGIYALIACSGLFVLQTANVGYEEVLRLVKSL